MIIGHGLPLNSSRLVIDVTPDNPNVVYLLSANNSNGFQGLYKSVNQGDDFVLTANESKKIYSVAFSNKKTMAEKLK